MRESPAAQASSPPASNAARALASAIGLGAIAFHLYNVAATSVDVPFLDDWDALLGFQIYWMRAETWSAKLRLLFDPHNEHLLAVPRVLVLLVHSLTGRVDFTWLNLVGNLLPLGLLAALWAGFLRREEAKVRSLAFLPAILLVMQPQAWTAVGSPTVSLSNLGVMALAAGCYAALARPGAARLTFAAGCAAAAIFTSANGILVAPLGSAVLWLRGDKRGACGWGAAALLCAGGYLLASPSDYAASDPLASLGEPLKLITYALNFIGSAAGFGASPGSLVCGVALSVGLGMLFVSGLPRRNAVVFALTLFILASVAANALLRAHQGAAAPLFQPRYRLYAAVLLALFHLGWLEVLSESARRNWIRWALAASLLFWIMSVSDGNTAARRHAAELEAGLSHWWQTGSGGLRHPDPRKAEFFLHAALDARLLRTPRDWGERFGATPRPATLPDARTAVSVNLDTVAQDGGWLTLIGRVRLAGDASQERIEIALASESAEFLVPALAVSRQAGPRSRTERSAQPEQDGFHALVDTRELPPGSYRLGIAVRQGERQHFAWTGTTLHITASR